MIASPPCIHSNGFQTLIVGALSFSSRLSPSDDCTCTKNHLIPSLLPPPYRRHELSLSLSHALSVATGNLEAKAISHRRRRTRTGRVRARAHVTSHYPSTEAVARGGSGGEGASERATAADNGGGICRSQNEKLLLFLPSPLPPLPP